MRRVLLVSLLGMGLLSGTMYVPPTPTAAAPKIEVKQPKPVVVVNADDPYELPETAIVAPEKPVKRGHNIILRVKPILNKPKGLVQTSYVWVISPKVDDLFAYPDNSAATFGSGDASDPNHYDITLVANYVYADADGKNPVLKTIEAATAVEVGEPTPAPTPTPTPTPDPTPTPQPTPAPVVPDGKYKLGQFILDQAKGLPAAEAAKLASTLRGLSSKIAAGGYKTKAELVNDTASTCSDALGSNIGNWTKALDALAKQMDTLKITALSDCKVAYDEVATGLEAVK